MAATNATDDINLGLNLSLEIYSGLQAAQKASSVDAIDFKSLKKSTKRVNLLLQRLRKHV